MKQISRVRPRRQQGAILLIAMVFLLMITIVAVVGSRRATLELQMATNEQIRSEYSELAKAVIDDVRSKNKDPEGLGSTYWKNCNTGSPDTDCDLNTLQANASYIQDIIDSGNALVNYSMSYADCKSTTTEGYILGESSASGGDAETAFRLYTVRTTISGQTSKSAEVDMEYGYLKVFVGECEGAGPDTSSGGIGIGDKIKSGEGSLNSDS